MCIAVSKMGLLSSIVYPLGTFVLVSQKGYPAKNPLSFEILRYFSFHPFPYNFGLFIKSNIKNDSPHIITESLFMA
jgi:hypothetical protein